MAPARSLCFSSANCTSLCSCHVLLPWAVSACVFDLIRPVLGATCLGPPVTLGWEFLPHQQEAKRRKSKEMFACKVQSYSQFWVSRRWWGTGRPGRQQRPGRCGEILDRQGDNSHEGCSQRQSRKINISPPNAESGLEDGHWGWGSKRAAPAQGWPRARYSTRTEA